MRPLDRSNSYNSRPVRKIASLLILLLVMGLHAPASSGDEPDSQLTAVASFNDRLGTAEFIAMPQTDYATPMCADWRSHCGDWSGAFDGIPIDDATPDRAGLWRDTRYFLGYQLATIGILYALPEGVSGWSSEQKKGYSMSIWWDNVTHPQIDSDDFYINYLLHPYWGAAYFVRARERGYSRLASFGYAALLSSAYEFGAEALFEEPSIQDIIVTPIMGSLVGMYFMHVRDNILKRDAQQNYRSTKDKWLWVLTDPLGSLNRKFDRLFGWEANLRIRPYVESQRFDFKIPPAGQSSNAETVFGLEVRFRW